MELAARSAPALNLDPKRIAATSVAIAVHVVVLMVLMLPVQMASAPLAKDTDMIVTPLVKVEPIKPPPLPPTPVHRTETRPDTRPHPVEVAVVNDTPTANDPHVDEVTTDPQPDNNFNVDPQPSFAQIRASLAPAPPYPAQAQRMRQSGLVMLKVLVDEQGQALEGSIETSSGFRVLDEAALKFVLKRWRFFPAQQDGKNVQAWALVPISFELPR